MRGDAGVVFPSRILAALAAGLLPQGRLGLLVPAPEQIEKLSEKWTRPGVEVVADALMPSASEEETATAAARLARRSPDLIAMDCMSYRPETKAVVQRTLRVPTVLAITATARVLQEVLT
jgi:protein AroM